MSSQELAVRNSQAMAEPLASSLAELATVAKAVIQSGYFPDAKSESQALVKMMWGHELGVGPMASVQGIWVIETRKGPALRLSGELMGALIKRAPGWDYTFSLTDDRCEVTVIHDGKALEPVSFTLTEARKAGLVRTGMPWDQYTKDMLWNRAMSRTKRHCASLFYGLSAPVLDADEADVEPMGHDQRKAIFAGLKGYEMTDDERHDWASDVLGRRVDSFADGHPTCPNRAEASILLAWLDDKDNVPAAAVEHQGVTVNEPDTAGEAPREEGGTGSGETASDWAEAPREMHAKVTGDWAVPYEAEEAAGAGEPGLGEVPTQPAPAPHVTESLLEPDEDPDLAKALGATALKVMRELWVKDPKKWRPWTRFAVNNIKAGSYESFPKGWTVDELTTLLDRMEKEETQ